MADVVNLTKRLIGKEDISFDTGGTYASEDFITPSGEHKNLSKINASHIPLVLDTREKFNNANNVDDALKEVGKRIDGFKALDTLAEDIEISFDNDATVNYMQSVINEQKKNLNGHTITFLFPVSLTQNMYSTLKWEDFFNGTIIIHGGTADNRIDLISHLNAMKSIFSIKRCQCEFKIRFFNFQHQNITYAIEAESTTSVIIENCIFYGMTDKYSAAVHNINSNIDFTNCDFSSDEKTDPDLITAHNTSDIAHADIRKNYLLLAGGTMTGTLKVANESSIMQNADNGVLRVYGGTNSNAPGLFIFGKDRTGYNGLVYLRTTDGTSTVDLKLAPDGTLTWGGSAVVCANSVNTGFLRQPNYAARTTTTASTYTASADGWVSVTKNNRGSYVIVRINGVFAGSGGGSDYDQSSFFFPVKKGDVVTTFGAENGSTTTSPGAATSCEIIFYPNR